MAFEASEGLYAGLSLIETNDLREASRVPVLLSLKEVPCSLCLCLSAALRASISSESCSKDFIER